jgi:hypothetical protein
VLGRTDTRGQVKEGGVRRRKGKKVGYTRSGKQQRGGVVQGRTYDIIVHILPGVDWDRQN